MMMLIFLKQSRHCSTFALLLPVRLMLLPSIFSQMTPELTKNKPQVTCGSFWLLVNLLRTTSSKSIDNSIVNVIVLCHLPPCGVSLSPPAEELSGQLLRSPGSKTSKSPNKKLIRLMNIPKYMGSNRSANVKESGKSKSHDEKTMAK